MGKKRVTKVCERIEKYRPLIEALEPRFVMHGSAPQHDFGAIIEVQTDSGFRPLDGALITTTNPMVRIRLDDDVVGKNVRVLLDDLDPNTPETNISDLFPGLESTGMDIATLDVSLGANTIVVRHRGHSETATMLNTADDILVVTSPVAHQIVSDKESDLKYEKDTLILNFVDDTSLQVISDFLNGQDLVPLDFARSVCMVRVEIPEGVSPIELGRYLVSLNIPYLEGAIPNVVLQNMYRHFLV